MPAKQMSSKIGNIFKMAPSENLKTGSPPLVVSLCCRSGIDAAVVKAQIVFSLVHPSQNIKNGAINSEH